jgi:hypothetical protein
MHRLQLHSEPYAPTGNIGDGGFMKLLGTPDLDVLQTVIREAIQNCCDAAKIGLGPQVLIRLRKLSSDQADALRSDLFSDLPANPESREHLEAFLRSKRPRVLEICDFDTTGLGGPTRADRIPTGNQTTDFIDFMRNVGTSRDTLHGGGTYGFGKVSLYLASRCSTILVDSLAQGGDPGARRLMACHLGPSHHEAQPDGNMKRFTGRHWWGQPSLDGDFVDPAFDEFAVSAARAVGLPDREKGRSGTSIMILDPCVGEDPDDLIVGRIIENLLYFFWPRMTADTSPTRKINVSVELDGKEVQVPAPEYFPPLDLFCKAIKKIRSNDPSVQVISSQRPIKRLGSLVIEKGMKGQRVPLVGSNSVFPTQSAHIAVMRPVELVVKYFEGQPLLHEDLEWAGVFIVDSDNDVERAFASAEPPAHDDWQPKMLLERSSERTYVNVALREIKKAAMNAADGGREEIAPGSDGPSLASLSDALGSFLGDNAEGGARPTSRKGGGTRKSGGRLSRPFFIGLEESGGRKAARFGMTASAGRNRLQVSFEPGLLIDGRFLSESEVDSHRRPSVLSIREKRSLADFEGRVIDISEEGGDYEIVVAIPDDCAGSLRVSVASEA